ncbi:ankyrin repeat domain-containing protein SOWAHB [Perognathus longimembris pacificus]|uniref:ankyrin repeat domain-containing protein SOWAHB n=1 Tax=Perognathus longimembris pacificus TaxID=214514 RepID=UPI0020185937|nr:ankyrin repeat domain-containing protein SOWAHB [Perognathus longimembris pacificus]
MARELSQEALLDFLCRAGGRVTNAALLSHFRSFLRDPGAEPAQHQRRRELFKGFVNSVAAVRPGPDGTKYVVLKRRYRDLLGEEGPPPAAGPGPGPAGGAAPRTPPGAPRTPPQSRRRRRERPRGEQPAGAAAPAPDAGGPGAPAGGAREAPRAERRRPGSPGARATAAPADGRCAAAETRGRCCWECGQRGPGPLPGEPPARALPDSARRGAAPAGPPREDAPAERAPGPDAPRAPPSPTPPPGDPPRPPGSPRRRTQQLRQLRTQEWVARHPPAPAARDRGPARAWTVLPDDFLGLTREPAPGVPESRAERPGPPGPAAPEAAAPEAAAWRAPRPPRVFRSLRCQLSLQDLGDFVDQESHGSEESSSGPRESPGGSEEGLPAPRGAPGRGGPGDPAAGPPASPEGGRAGQGPRAPAPGEGGPASRRGPGGAAGGPPEPAEPAPRPRRSLRRSSGAGRAGPSSSEEEHLEDALRKRNRRPPRPRKPPKAGPAPSPRVDAALTPSERDVRAAGTEGGPGREGLTALVPRRSEPKSSLVPLDAREHAWIVTLARGAWAQVLTLFREDPQLVLHRDFLTGYTALHWTAKHGHLGALQALASGARRAGIALDVNVRSGCGYTPLHLAAMHGHQGVIKLLVQRLASRVNIRDSSGKKPWQYLSSNTSGEVWQLLGAPRGKPIFPVYPLVRSSSPPRKAKSRDISRNITRKTSLAALLKNQHSKWKLANQYEKFHAPQEREEYSD